MTDWDDAIKLGADPFRSGNTWKPGGGGADDNTGANGNGADHAAESGSFELVCLADVDPIAVDWLWQDRLARGHLALFASDPGLGKSQITIDLAARLSLGAHWPLGPTMPVASTIFLCSEDSIADTIRPRAEAAGADLSKVHVLKSALVKNGKKKSFNLGEDLDVLAAATKSVGDVGLVCIDAITSYMGKIDSHRNTDVRSVLEPVAGFAEAHKVSVLGVTHIPKSSHGSALKAFLGSVGFIATCRMALLATVEAETDRRLFLSVKNSFGPLARGIGYRISAKTISNGIVAPYVTWSDEPVDVTADQALAAASAEIKDPRAMKRTKEFLLDLLKDGTVDAKDGEEAAEAEGISERTLKRAWAKLGIKSTKTGFDGGWQWSRPK